MLAWEGVCCAGTEVTVLLCGRVAALLAGGGNGIDVTY